MGVTRVTGGDACNCKRKRYGEMSRVPVCAETDFPTYEAIHELQGGVSARFPSFPDAKRGLSFINVTRPFHPVFSVNLVATVSAITADDAVKSGSNRGDGVNGFAEDPHLDHVTGFSIVGGFGKARRDYDTVLIFVEDKSIAHREPPLITVNRTLCPVVSFRPVGYPMKAANSTIERFLV